MINLLLHIGRNIAGILLIIIGVVIWITPLIGGSLLFLIPGIMLLRFPGKRKLFERLEQTKFISNILVKHPKIKNIWKKLYADPEPGKQESGRL